VDDIKKAEHISHCVKKLFHTRGKEKLSTDLMKTWIQGLMPFNIKDVSDAFFEKMYDTDPFPTMGHIVNMLIGNSPEDAYRVWGLFESYCDARLDYERYRKEDIKDLMDRFDKKLSKHKEKILLICNYEKFVDCDRWQAERYKEQYIKIHTNSTDKIENYLLKNNSKLLELK